VARIKHAPASSFDFWRIGAYVAKFSRTLDELAFSPGAFLVVHGLIAEAPLDFSVCHLGCFEFAFFATQ
jgi:hypothetical protein